MNAPHPIYDDEIDSALLAVGNPDAPYNPEALVLAAAVRQLRAELATYKRDDRHIVDLRADGWTIQHPMACRPNLFDCPVNRAAGVDLTGPPAEIGQFYCDLVDGWFAILDRVPQAKPSGATS
jgi:hypothetical protein